MVTEAGHRFSEQETEEYYDAEDVIYRSVWDADGSVHWGVFDGNLNGDTIREQFLAAGIRLNELMVEYAGIDENSKVLDVGCGNGNAAIWLSRNSGAHVTGVDLSGVRVANAVESLQNVPELAGRLAFEKASATELPFDEGTFTHFWSQATVYHVPDKVKVLQEAYRVLQPGGMMIFDDLIKPRTNISESARKIRVRTTVVRYRLQLLFIHGSAARHRFQSVAGPGPVIPFGPELHLSVPAGLHCGRPRGLPGPVRLPCRRLHENG